MKTDNAMAPRVDHSRKPTGGGARSDYSCTVADRILRFNKELEKTTLEVPNGYSIMNPFAGDTKGDVQTITTAFYGRFYSDNIRRRLVLGSSPARRGSAVTGVPFADTEVLARLSGREIVVPGANRKSSSFLDEVIHRYGGFDRYYGDFIMSFVCPLGITKRSARGREVNANYYDNRELRESLDLFIVDALKLQLTFGVDTSVCYCIGSGENFKYLSKINQAEGMFGRIVPLEHPRFVMQYNSYRKEEYIMKYVTALSEVNRRPRIERCDE